MKFFLSIFVLFGLALSPAAVAALQPMGVATRNVVKPGAVISKRVMRHFDSRKRRKEFFGALAISTTDGRKWYATSGFNSSKVAADVARLTCEAKAGEGHDCVVVALRVPKSMPGTFSQLLSSTGLSTGCEMSWSDVRIPRKRPSNRWGRCWVEHVAKNGPNSNRARESGHTMFIARNDFYSGVMTFGPDPERAKREAMIKCQAAHEALLETLEKKRWRNPNRRIINAADLTIEASVTSAYLENNKQLARCRIVHQEVLP